MKLFKILFLFICVSGFAQSKVGTIDVDYILSKMPELENVQKEIKTYSETLDVDLNKKLTAYNEAVKTYQAGEATFTEAEKNEKRQAITSMEEDIAKFQQNGTKLMGIKQDNALKPLYAKIGEALDKIAKAENYTQVMQLDEKIVFLDSDYDLTVAVLKELGIPLQGE